MQMQPNTWSSLQYVVPETPRLESARLSSSKNPSHKNLLHICHTHNKFVPLTNKGPHSITQSTAECKHVDQLPAKPAPGSLREFDSFMKP